MKISKTKKSNFASHFRLGGWPRRDAGLSYLESFQITKNITFYLHRITFCFIFTTSK